MEKYRLLRLSSSHGRVYCYVDNTLSKNYLIDFYCWIMRNHSNCILRELVDITDITPYYPEHEFELIQRLTQRTCKNVYIDTHSSQYTLAIANIYISSSKLISIMTRREKIAFLLS